MSGQELRFRSNESKPNPCPHRSIQRVQAFIWGKMSGTYASLNKSLFADETMILKVGTIFALSLSLSLISPFITDFR